MHNIPFYRCLAPPPISIDFMSKIRFSVIVSTSNPNIEIITPLDGAQSLVFTKKF